jgi:polysaccharide pyruvyl transferase WcaK-like protein
MVYGNSFRLYPTPDSSMTVSITMLSTLSPSPDEYTASVSNSWTNDAYDLIRYRAKADVFMNFIRDFQAAQAMVAMERDSLDKLTERSTLYKYSGQFEGYI